MREFFLAELFFSWGFFTELRGVSHGAGGRIRIRSRARDRPCLGAAAPKPPASDALGQQRGRASSFVSAMSDESAEVQRSSAVVPAQVSSKTE